MVGDLWIWSTGETELSTVRTSAGGYVNKHYDLDTSADLDLVLDELVQLIRDGSIPSGAVTEPNVPKPSSLTPTREAPQ